MSDNGNTMKDIPPGDEDDWETADIATFGNKHSLRPSAPTFQPRPPTSSSSSPASSAAPVNDAPKGQRGILGRNAGNGVAVKHVQAPPGGLSPSWPTLAKPNRGAEQRSAASKSSSPANGSEPSASDSEWFRGGQKGSTNRQIWDSANATTITPLPASMTLETPIALPPPTIKILRREPNSSTGSSRSGKGSENAAEKQKTLADREEEYRLARERIFGSGSGSGSASNSNIAGSSSEDAIKRGGSGNGSGKGGRRSGNNSPVPSRALSGDTRESSGRHTPAGTAPGGGGGTGATNKGLVRQPRGPGEGLGFGFGSASTSLSGQPPVEGLGGASSSYGYGSGPTMSPDALRQEYEQIYGAAGGHPRGPTSHTPFEPFAGQPSGYGYDQSYAHTAHGYGSGSGQTAQPTNNAMGSYGQIGQGYDPSMSQHGYGAPGDPSQGNNIWSTYQGNTAGGGNDYGAPGSGRVAPGGGVAGARNIPPGW